MEFDNNLIKERIGEILNGKLFVPKSLLDSELDDEPLTGSKFHLSGVDMVYLLFEIEKTFGIRVNEKHIRAYGICSINKLIDVIKKYIN